MAKTITISDAYTHNTHNKPKQTMVLKMEGGSPWFCYVWINDVIYTITVDGETGKLHIRKT